MPRRPPERLCRIETNQKSVAAVILAVIQKVFTGPVPEKWATFPDLHTGERLALAPAISLMLLLGLLPQLIVDSVNPTVLNLLAHWRF